MICQHISHHQVTLVCAGHSNSLTQLVQLMIKDARFKILVESKRLIKIKKVKGWLQVTTMQRTVTQPET